MQDTYKTIKSPGQGFFKDKGSKFHAYAYPVQNEEEINEILNSIKKEHHSARHHCFAWRLGKEEISSRANDDGEPTFTAGKPILRQLESFEVTNTLAVVVRYFGGTLLGTSGLINAYKTAASDALSNCIIITNTIDTIFRLNYSYNEMNDVMKIIKQENLNIIDTKFEVTCRLDLSVRRSEATHVEKLFKQFPGISIEKSPENK